MTAKNMVMDKTELEKKIHIIFNGEKKQPTVHYIRKDTPLFKKASSSPLIYESPHNYIFESRNVDMLRKLYTKISQDKKSQETFLSELYLSFIENTPHYDVAYLSFVTLIRLNKMKEAITHLNAFFEVKNLEPYYRTLIRLSSILCYEHSFFSNEDLDNLISFVEIALPLTKANISKLDKSHPLTRQENPNRILGLLDLIKDQIERIHYLRLKEELEETQVLEINQDKIKVKEKIKEFGFPEDLIKSLDEFEREYYKAVSDFDYKNCIGHVRSFSDELNKHITRKVEAKTNMKFTGNIDKATEVRDYLTKKEVSFATKKEHDLLRAIHGVSSDQGVHPLTADKESARVCKNIAIEVALLMLNRLEQFLK